MKIETKYEIGQHIWCVFDNVKNQELEVFDTSIVGISADKDGWKYLVDPANFFDVSEDEIIIYEDKDKLYNTICEKMKKKNEENKND